MNLGEIITQNKQWWLQNQKYKSKILKAAQDLLVHTLDIETENISYDTLKTSIIFFFYLGKSQLIKSF